MRLPRVVDAPVVTEATGLCRESPRLILRSFGYDGAYRAPRHVSPQAHLLDLLPGGLTTFGAFAGGMGIGLIDRLKDRPLSSSLPNRPSKARRSSGSPRLFGGDITHQD